MGTQRNNLEELLGLNLKRLDRYIHRRVDNSLETEEIVQETLLDLTSDFQGLKKQTGNDIYEGKRTIMLAHLLRTAKGNNRKGLIKILSKKREEKTAGEVNLVIDLMKKYNSFEYGRKMAADLAGEAMGFFERNLGFLKNQPARDQLKAGINFILKRDY